jgi:NADH-quinone oxidoreductase subunit N
MVPGKTAEAFGGMYHYVPMMGVLKTILNICTLVVFLMAREWLAREDTRIKQGEFYILTLCTLLGMYFMTSAGHFLLFFIGLETASIPMATLVAFDKYRHHSAEAGAKYILMALFSSGLLLYGLSLIYGTTGALYFNDIPAGLTGSPMQLLALVLFFTGMAFKISLVPFHLWTADVYEGSPTVVTSYLSAVSKGASAFSLLIILINVFAPLVAEWQTLLFWVTIVTITTGNVFAIRQKNLKRFMAFSSISQAGYIMLGIMGGNAAGMTAKIYYILVYGTATLAVFVVMSVVEQKSGKIKMDNYNGLYKTNPKLALLMTLSLFSLAGIPPFAGFFSKFFIFMAAFEAGFHIPVFIALVNTVVSLYYYLLIVKAMYINTNEEPVATFRSDNYSRAGLLICTIGILLLGLFSAVYQAIDTYSFGL